MKLKGLIMDSKEAKLKIMLEVCLEEAGKMKNCFNCKHRRECNTLQKIVVRLEAETDYIEELPLALCEEDKETFLCVHWELSE